MFKEMLEIIDKLIIFLCCLSLYLLEPSYGQNIIPIIISVTIGSLNSYFERADFRTLSFITYSILSVFNGEFLIFLPLLFYDVILNKPRLIYIFGLIPIMGSVESLSTRVIVITLSFMVVTAHLKIRTISTTKLRVDYISFKDNASEVSILLEEKNASLIANQDHEINVATLSERNRIAREIHDNLGHILSRCLLQIGALNAINKDLVMQENLRAIKETLSQGMDSVRKSVHDLHNESINLQNQIYGLVKDFSFCPIKLNYDISENPDKKLKYSLISILREALSNIIKHSNATEVSVNLIEHPGFYQFVIQDNGTVKNYNPENGIGIRNIIDRVEALKGNVNINIENGFKIFITIPKEPSK